MDNYIVAVIDNNTKERNNCDDCGAVLRYEYHVSNDGLYGSECVHRHIHSFSDYSLNGRKDSKIYNEKIIWAERQANWIINNCKITEVNFIEYNDCSGRLFAGKLSYTKNSEFIVKKLLEYGWKKEVDEFYKHRNTREYTYYKIYLAHP